MSRRASVVPHTTLHTTRVGWASRPPRGRVARPLAGQGSTVRQADTLATTPRAHKAASERPCPRPPRSAAPSSFQRKVAPVIPRAPRHRGIRLRPQHPFGRVPPLCRQCGMGRHRDFWRGGTVGRETRACATALRAGRDGVGTRTSASFRDNGWHSTSKRLLTQQWHPGAAEAAGRTFPRRWRAGMPMRDRPERGARAKRA